MYILNTFRVSPGSRALSSAFVIAFALLMSSCEKVIDIDLNDADKKVVVEANLSDQANSCVVLLSRSKRFDDANMPVGISNAIVTISDNNGAPVPLVETTTGRYELPSLVGMPGHTYQLQINVSGQSFTASSTIPQQVPFDSLYITERTFFNETNKYATVTYKDPLTPKNAYRFIQYVNGQKEKTLFVRDDDSNNGLNINRALIYFFDDEQEDSKALKSGDLVTIDMLCISYPIFKYWNSLSDGALGDNQSSTPANPLSNIQGGGLGYFSAHTVESKTVVVP